MGNIYTISELCNLLSVTRPIVEKRLEKLWDNKEIPYTYKTINNREIKAIELSGEQEHAIGIGDVKNTPSESPINTHGEQSKALPSNEELVLKILNFSDKYNTDMKSYIDRVINAESQLLLLEDKTKDKEFFKQESIKFQQENAMLLAKLELVENELSENKAQKELSIRLNIELEQVREKLLQHKQASQELGERIKTLEEENEKLRQKTFFGIKLR